MAKLKNFFAGLGRRIKSCFGIKSAIFFGIFAVMLLIDLLTKYYEEKDAWEFVVIPGFIEVMHGIRNTGASFSMGANSEWALTFFIALTFIIIPVVFFIILFLPERFTVLKLSLYMINAGAIGNLVDRLMFGAVRDFIGVHINSKGFYCNFADIWLVAGAIIVIIDFLFLNEMAIFPLTKRAKAQAAERREKEERERKEKDSSFKISSSCGEGTENTDADAETGVLKSENRADKTLKPGLKDSGNDKGGDDGDG